MSPEEIKKKRDELILKHEKDSLLRDAIYLLNSAVICSSITSDEIMEEFHDVDPSNLPDDFRCEMRIYMGDIRSTRKLMDRYEKLIKKYGDIYQ